MDIQIKNATGFDAAISIEPSSGWQLADVYGKVAQFASAGYAAASGDPAELSAVIRGVKLGRATAGVTTSLINIFKQNPQFGILRSGGTSEHDNLPPMTFSDLFRPSWWGELTGSNTARMFICAESTTGPAAMTLPVSALRSSSWTITPKGVREGLDGTGRLHRWGEGGQDTRLPTSSPPSIVWYQGQFHMFYTEGDAGDIRHAVSSNGMNWTPGPSTGLRASSGPCAVPYIGIQGNEELHLFFRDPTGNALINVNTPYGVDFTNRGQTILGINIDDEPSAVQRAGGGLHVIGRDSGGAGVVFATFLPGIGWRSGYTEHDQTTSAPPGLVVFNNQLHMFYRDGARGTNGIIHGVSSDGLSWYPTEPLYIGFTTSAGPRAVVHKGRLRVIFVDGQGDGILGVQSNDGFHFYPESDWYLGVNGRREPAPFAFAAPGGNEVCLLATMSAGNAYQSSTIVCTMPELDVPAPGPMG